MYFLQIFFISLLFNLQQNRNFVASHILLNLKISEVHESFLRKVFEPENTTQTQKTFQLEKETSDLHVNY